jgi:prevent-host-death family protein
MYTEIGAFDAKAKLSELLREVRAGQRYTITVRGEPVADLVPYTGRNDVSKAAAVAAMQQFKRIKGVSAEEIAAWIAEGRK